VFSAKDHRRRQVAGFRGKQKVIHRKRQVAGSRGRQKVIHRGSKDNRKSNRLKYKQEIGKRHC
jgi:hypothetical protein